MENESHSATPSTQPDGGSVAKDSRRLSRRAMLRAGASASPVLLTLASGPVSATNTVGCMVASSFVSVATFKSRNPNTTITCSSAFNCEYWRTQAGLATPPADLNLKVKQLLGAAPSSYAETLVKTVLLQGGGIATTGPLGVAQHCLSLALSAKGNKLTSPGSVNLSYIRGVWTAYNSTAPNYIAPSGVVLTEAQLIGWLRALLGYAII
jgi:hypothetical protein